MPAFDLLLSPAAIGPGDLTPPPRFAQATFASYRLDAQVAGQAAAVARIQAWAQHTAWWRRWFSAQPPGLYLDGPFGVGKTHLLAACWHATRGTRHYLSFAEAMGLMVLHGPTATIDLLAADLVCLDEFELDDPTNTRLADLLLDGLAERGARIITTSNTVVGELGSGRMAVDLFRAQLTRIGARFAGVHVPGPDHRRLHVAEGQDPAAWGPQVQPDRAWPTCTPAQLDAWLSEVPVAHLRRVAARLPGLNIVGMEPYTDQLAALRFVALIDRCYDHDVRLRVQSAHPIARILPEPPLREAFHRKHRRCQSRLVELADEARAQ